jgi:hypothetical protein
VLKNARYVLKLSARLMMVNHSLHAMFVLFLFVGYAMSTKGRRGISLVLSVKLGTRGIKVNET